MFSLSLILLLLFTQTLCQDSSQDALDSDYRIPTSSLDPLASIFRYRQQQSVNLGSWFVLEQWMAPSLFSCARDPKLAEIDVAFGDCNPQAILEKHWNTFITQQDFDYLASIGINSVRIPIGYWSLGPTFLQDTPFANASHVYQNAWSSVIHAINMAFEAGIGVLIDLHGAPGSQNGQPHSGISDGKTNLFTSSTYQDQTLQVLVYLAKELCEKPNVLGIQLLNEPENRPELTDFYNRAVNAVRAIIPDSFPLYIHDGFDLARFREYLSSRPSDFVVIDHHSYFVYTPEDNAEAASDHTNDVETTVAAQLANPDETKPNNLIIGEWSCALTPDSLKNEPDPQAARRKFCMAQLNIYRQNTPGNSFWSYKKEDCDTDWCFLNAVNNSLPNNFFAYSSSPIPQSLIEALKPDYLSGSNDLVQRSPSGESSYRHRSRAIVHRQTYRTDTSPEMKAYEEGYTQGFEIAQKYAAFGGSKLGFVEQYIIDTAPSSFKGTEAWEFYRQGFIRGLRDAEEKISNLAGNI